MWVEKGKKKKKKYSIFAKHMWDKSLFFSWPNSSILTIFCYYSWMTVVDGLETLFSPNHTATTNAILKVFNNRKFIFFITLRLEQPVLQAREKRQQEEKGWFVLSNCTISKVSLMAHNWQKMKNHLKINFWQTECMSAIKFYKKEWLGPSLDK